MTYHDKPHFFKYVPMDGLGHITSRLSRRWTCPVAFNDPFDAQFDCGFPFTFEAFSHAFLDAIEDMVFGDTEPECTTGDRPCRSHMMDPIGCIVLSGRSLV